ncbi:hypothetical protein HYC85_032108 [Camellia sinensis]|uniref:Uncharacterized protein n=1 Tax=Camellia sinensis TaxID=4442 RepID=A0A7J7FSD8_CAMSI|nr:hypothetical protein HYC85_032108 [Camellia sinensis]
MEEERIEVIKQTCTIGSYTIESTRVWLDDLEGLPFSQFRGQWGSIDSLYLPSGCSEVATRVYHAVCQILQHILLDMPSLAFFTTYALLVLFWAEIYYQARAVSTDGLRLSFYTINAMVYVVKNLGAMEEERIEEIGVRLVGRTGGGDGSASAHIVLLCKPEDVKRIMGILNDSCPPLHSCLSEDTNGMTHAILEVVAGGIVQTANDIHRYVRCTLLNSTKPFEDVVKSGQDSLRWLCHRKFIEWNENTKLYSTTPLGRASFGSSLCREESLIVLDDLSRAREGFVLASNLYLVYLVTPTNVEVEPDWKLYYERFMQLSTIDQLSPEKWGANT